MTDDSILRLADLPRPAGEQHEMDPPHHLCLGDDPCICIHLAACEQRVRESEACLALCADRNYQRGLDAAREAVAAAYDDERYGHKDDWGVPVVYKDLMLAAIDALRGDR